MSNFRTILTVPKANFSIAHQHKLLSVGSCFAENIGQRLEQLKFNIVRNPFGILYNPISIAKGLNRLLSTNVIDSDALFKHNELWHHFDFHSQFANSNQDEALNQINQSINKGHHQLQVLDTLILTFGTAYVFEYIETQQVVGNCHKLPNHLFNRRLLSLKAITDSIYPILKKLQTLRPNLNIILTVSPIRHIRDGLIQNQRSKATLLLAIETLQKQLSNVHYFPSYEIMMDDLRDYRFYGKDLIHPNEMALDYIWDSFSNTYFNETTLQLNQQLHKLQKAMAHRPFNPHSNQHQTFLQKQLNKVEQLSKQYPYLNFKVEKDFFDVV